MAVCLDDELGRRLLPIVKHFVFQFHESSHDAAQLSVEQVVVGVGGLYAAQVEILWKHVQTGVERASASWLIELDDDLPEALPIDVSVAIQTDVVGDGGEHNCNGFWYVNLSRN